MNRERIIGALALVGVLVWWFANRKGSGVPAVSLGRLETSTTTQAGAADIVAQAESLATANEDPAVARLRSETKNFGVRVTSCQFIDGKNWCNLSNGWRLPSWLVVDYLGIPNLSSN